MKEVDGSMFLPTLGAAALSVLGDLGLSIGPLRFDNAVSCLYLIGFVKRKRKCERQKYWRTTEEALFSAWRMQILAAFSIIVLL